MLKIFATSFVIAATAACAVQAATVHPTSYYMNNGASGSFNYWDDSYTGSGNNRRDGAFLSGGLGDLTDGVIATQNWNRVEGPRGPVGPYVGWVNTNPSIVFRFDTAQKFNTVTFHFDSNGGGGGVGAPSSVTINGQTQRVVAPGRDPFAYTFDLVGTDAFDILSVTINRGASWVFLSEVTFDAQISPVPLPASGLMLMAGMGGMALMRRRSKKRA